MPSFLPATRRQQFSKGLGILSYTAGTGFAFKHLGANPDLLIKNQTLYLELMQSTRTCSPVAPSGFRPDKIQHAQISFALRATQATFKSTSAQQRTTVNYRNGNRSWPQSLELITLPSPSKLVWLACKAPSATPVWNLPLTDRPKPHRASKDSHPLSRTLPRRPIYCPPTPCGDSGQPLSGRRSSA